MAEFRLVFRGEIAEGQHRAVVKKRLQASLKLEDERVERLFTGATVVVRKAVDAKLAARFRQVFKEAGALLHVVPIENEAPDSARSVGPSAMTDVTSAAGHDETRRPVDASSDGNSSTETEEGWGLAPAGADLLAGVERKQPVISEVDTSHLTLAAQAAFELADQDAGQVVEIEIPNLTLAEVGTPLGAAGQHEPEFPEITLSETWEVAEPGVILSIPRAGGDATIPDVDFELAEPGTNLVEAKPEANVPVPVTEHLELV